MKPKVFITKQIPEEVERYIAEHCEYSIWEEETPIPEAQLKEKIKDVDGLICPKANVTESLLSHAPNLKVISNIAVGYDSFDTELMESHGVLGTHTPYVLDETVADLIFGLILSAARRIPEMDKFVRSGQWSSMEDTSLFGKDVHGATLGIVGLGRIGEKVARRAKFGFNMNVQYYNRSRREELEEKYGLEKKSMEELMQSSDFILTMVPLSPETTKLIGEKEFSLMKQEAVFINASRGKVVDESALIEALKSNKIRGAALDVFEQEPVDAANPLLSLDNVVLTPHLGSATQQARDAMAMKAAENLVAGVTGQAPPNVVKELQHLVP
ncbi:D-glycerate dehydrogenase [Halobacillus rhizosphaerae]|uniref:2-hydroxyacid dehydrogenase n=1 Tax=Halobacillus rhizosphaerae TaxID=3064889 RepID=UPI00398B87C7